MTAALAETIGSAVVKGRPVFIDAGEVRVPNMSDSVRHDPDFLEFYRTFGNYLSNLLLNGLNLLLLTTLAIFQSWCSCDLIR